MSFLQSEFAETVSDTAIMIDYSGNNILPLGKGSYSNLSNWGANSHFLRTAGPHFPDSPGHIKRTAWDISRAGGTPPH